MSPRTSRQARDRLRDILDAITHTRQAEALLIRADRDGDLETAQVALDAITYNLIVIGEAVNALPDGLTASEPEVPWQDIIGMRNFLSHEYFRVLSHVVRQTIDRPLEQLRQACQRLLDSTS